MSNTHDVQPSDREADQDGASAGRLNARQTGALAALSAALALGTQARLFDSALAWDLIGPDTINGFADGIDRLVNRQAHPGDNPPAAEAGADTEGHRHAFFITVSSTSTREQVRKTLAALIDIGLADAQETLEKGEGGDVEAATIAIHSQWSAPQ